MTFYNLPGPPGPYVLPEVDPVVVTSQNGIHQVVAVQAHIAKLMIRRLHGATELLQTIRSLPPETLIVRRRCVEPSWMRLRGEIVRRGNGELIGYLLTSDIHRQVERPKADVTAFVDANPFSFDDAHWSFSRQDWINRFVKLVANPRYPVDLEYGAILADQLYLKLKHLAPAFVVRRIIAGRGTSDDDIAWLGEAS